MNQISEITQEEQMVIDLIRSRDFQNITIQVNGGKIVLVRREETIKPDLVSSRNRPNPGD